MFIFGSSSFAEIAAAYFTRANEYEVLGHIVDSEFKNGDSLGTLPQFAADSTSANQVIKASTHFFVAATYTQLNRFRTKKYLEYKAMGLLPASYISPDAFIDPTVKIGDHSFIFEKNVIQYGTTIGSNCIIWSGNHIGHHSFLNNNLFLSSHVVISGHCKIGSNSFLGVNATIYNNVEVGADNWIGPNSVVAKSTEANVMMRADPSKTSPIETTKFFKITD
jgi:sugar O-acyltransferase (sialic acid O-acetyltransferase NeuD family)